MRMYRLLCMLGVLCMISFSGQLQAQVSVDSPDGKLNVKVTLQEGGVATYALTYNGKAMLQDSPLGLVTNVSDFTKGLTMVEHSTSAIDKTYKQDRIKKSEIHYVANEL
ncbi:MAG: glycoside hydrolase family 97 N-terminal domain-containing protein, partial [Bacteroides sp.]|nr:glycoside hydrolase family 97 N-terminal domain-containing protein [Bacteroides sp.]